MPTDPAASGAQTYGLKAMLAQGGPIAWTVFIILVIMSIVSWYIMLSKLFEQQKIIKQARTMRTSFWGSPSLKEGANKLEKNSAYRQLVDDGLLAESQHKQLTDPIDQHEWVHGSLTRSQAAIASKLSNGLAFLATVGSTAPFIGLFGTVMGIYGALINIGAAGQASIDKVAGPVGEALIMTALGLVVAVPAVLGYNWMVRRNKSVIEQLAAFTADLHGYMVSGGAVRPTTAGPAKIAAPGKTSPATGSPTGSAGAGTTSR